MKLYWDSYDLVLEKEVWKTIVGYENLYMVSNYGRVKRLVSKNCRNERVLKQNIIVDGRLMVKLSKNSEKKNYLVSRLVAIAFIPNKNNFPVVCHSDDNFKNNMSDNLWWGTQKDNILDCHKKGRASNNLPILFGQNHPKRKKYLS